MTDQSIANFSSTTPALCAGCSHFKAAGSTILTAEPACGARRSAAGSDFQSYFESRRLLLRARAAASCQYHLATDLPD
jgi:hypothetical protein